MKLIKVIYKVILFQGNKRTFYNLPFLFYDLDYEIQTPLKIYPYQLMDFSLLKYTSFLDKKETLLNAISEVKKVNGLFTFVFHNYALSSIPRWSDFKSLFNIILETNNEISK